MSTAVLCVGKMKDKAYRELADEYLKRLGRYGKIEEIEIPDLPEPAGNSPALEEQVKTREGEALLSKIRPGDRVIALTISKELSGSYNSAMTARENQSLLHFLKRDQRAFRISASTPARMPQKA